MASLPYRNIEYLGWHEDVIPFLKSADLVLLPSRAEGVPRSLVEAMAAGRPVLATNVGGIPDLVIDGETGFLVPVDDAEQLAEKLIWFRDHPVERRQMGQKARAYVENKHDIKTHVELLAQHIRRVSKATPDTY
jgi:glycosyltransferase involved in cell wall biosynthesis